MCNINMCNNSNINERNNNNVILIIMWNEIININENINVIILMKYY